MIGRRKFIRLLGGAATGWPLAARAQGQRLTIGFLHAGTPNSYMPYASGFSQGLKELGFVEGQNLTIEYRWANARPDQLPGLAADLVQRQVAVMVVGGGTPSAVAAKEATAKIPIVLVFGSNPVSLGLVASLNRPGGNVTGVTFLTSELMSRRLGLLLELAPNARTVGYLAENPQMYAETRTLEEMKSEMLTSVRARGRQLMTAEIGNDLGFDAAFAMFAEHQVGVLVVQPSPLFASYINQIVSLAARHRIPAIYYDRRFTAAGGLMAYSTDIVAAWREGGSYVGKILKGASPADMPVAQSAKFEFIINLKTARALGLDVPPGLLAIADEVIE